jgi:acyl carrier protein
MDIESVAAKILELVRSIHPGVEAEQAERLVVSGLFDSIDFEELFFLVEDEFGVSIPSEEFSLENCAGVSALARMVSRYLGST